MGDEAGMDGVTLYAMSAKGLAVVQRFIDAWPNVLRSVVTARDTAVERDFADEIIAVCRRGGVPCQERLGPTPNPLGSIAIAVSWRWLIDCSGSTVVVLHDSLLPRYRGFNPLVTALVNGDTRLGVTALLATGEFDRGPIIAQRWVDISYPVRVAAAIDRLLECYVGLADSLGAAISDGSQLIGNAQDESKASYSLWRDDEDYFIDWTQPAGRLRRFIDATGFPYRGAATRMDGETLRVLAASELDDVKIENRTPGKVLFYKDGKPVVVCGKGLLRIDSLWNEARTVEIGNLPRFRIRFR